MSLFRDCLVNGRMEMFRRPVVDEVGEGWVQM